MQQNLNLVRARTNQKKKQSDTYKQFLTENSSIIVFLGENSHYITKLHTYVQLELCK